jgi:hypothetical protein
MPSSKSRILNPTTINHLAKVLFQETGEVSSQIEELEFKFKIGRVPVQTSEYYRTVKCIICKEDKGLAGQYLDFFIRVTNRPMLRIFEATCIKCAKLKDVLQK